MIVNKKTQCELCVLVVCVCNSKNIGNGAENDIGAVVEFACACDCAGHARQNKNLKKEMS